MISARWRGGVVARRSIQPARGCAVLLIDRHRRDAGSMACTRSPIDARAGYVFHNGGARVMGSAQALPERIDKDTAERVAGRHFAARRTSTRSPPKRRASSRGSGPRRRACGNPSFTLREVAKKLDFGFVAEEKEDARKVACAREYNGHSRTAGTRARSRCRPLGKKAPACVITSSASLPAQALSRPRTSSGALLNKLRSRMA